MSFNPFKLRKELIALRAKNSQLFFENAKLKSEMDMMERREMEMTDKITRLENELAYQQTIVRIASEFITGIQYENVLRTQQYNQRLQHGPK